MYPDTDPAILQRFEDAPGWRADHRDLVINIVVEDPHFLQRRQVENGLDVIDPGAEPQMLQPLEWHEGAHVNLSNHRERRKALEVAAEPDPRQVLDVEDVVFDVPEVPGLFIGGSPTVELDLLY